MTTIDVCVCTFRRASLRETLASIAGQKVPDTDVRVIVADNDDLPLRKAEIEEAGRELGLELRYLHAPARNISLARNACLDAASAEWIAFIDDDEVAAPDWLATLLAGGQGCDVAFGVSQAVYPPEAPRWIASGDFLSNRLQGNDQFWNGYTANVLIRRSFVRDAGLLFDPALGQTGGEDTLFFFDANQKGARFGYEPSAVVYEPVLPARLSLRWLLLRRFRSGQTHHLVLRKSGKHHVGSLMAGPKAAAALTLALATVARPKTAVRHLLRAALHVGVLFSAAGLSTYREYRSERRQA